MVQLLSDVNEKYERHYGKMMQLEWYDEKKKSDKNGKRYNF